MLTELLGKGGNVCTQAKQGEIKCPLLVRPTSEDVITGHLFHTLGAVNSRWWLPQLLNEALGARRFRQQVFRRLRIELWKNRPPYPRELLPWVEGSTQVDVTVTWENPPTTVFIEMKYGSGLATKTQQSFGDHGFPSDQLIRNARVGLRECGWFRQENWFESLPRDFVLLLIAPRVGDPLVANYRDSGRLRAGIPHSQKLLGLPRTPFLGELSYLQIIRLLRRQLKFLSRPERLVMGTLIAYLELKIATVPGRGGNDQLELDLST